VTAWYAGQEGTAATQLHSFLIYAPHYMVVTSEPHAQDPPMQIKTVFSLEPSATDCQVMQHQIPVEGNSHPAAVLLTFLKDVMRYRI
jgi:hypothetical protein